MSLLCSKFCNSSHFIQSKNAPVHSEWGKKALTVASKAFRDLCHPHSSSISPLLSLTHLLPATLEILLFLEDARHAPTSGCSLCLPRPFHGSFPPFQVSTQMSHQCEAWHDLFKVVTPTSSCLTPLLKVMFPHVIFYIWHTLYFTFCLLSVFPQ